MLNDVVRTQLKNIRAGQQWQDSEVQVTDTDVTLLAEALTRLGQDFSDFKVDTEAKFRNISP